MIIQLIFRAADLVTITGGKWTTYRRMAEDTIDQAAELAQLEPEQSISSTLQIHGYHQHSEEFGDLQIYGSDAPAIQAMLEMIILSANNCILSFLHLPEK